MIVYSWSPNNMYLNCDIFEHHQNGNNLEIEKHSYMNLTGKIKKKIISP